MPLLLRGRNGDISVSPPSSPITQKFHTSVAQFVNLMFLESDTSTLSILFFSVSLVVFLAKLLIILVISALDFLFDTRLLISPLNAFLRYIPPPNGPCKPVTPHPYLAPGTLLIAGTTLFLFYASGMYSEKIALANK